MIYINSDTEYDYFLGNYEGQEVRMRKERKTGVCTLSSQDVAKCLGFDSLSDMLESNKEIADVFLDGINNGSVFPMGSGKK